MASTFRSTREVIIRTEAWEQAVKFYESTLGLKATPVTDTMVGFETGTFCLYVEKGKPHAPVFEFLVPDVQAAKRELVAAGCTVVEEDASAPRCYIRDPYGVVFNIGRTASS
jgi:predicted enzyme related to lactoylglutathione lyase